MPCMMIASSIYPHPHKQQLPLQNCIRHNLSMKRCFVREEASGGNYWSINMQYGTEAFTERERRGSSCRKRRASAPSSSSARQSCDML